MIIYCSIFCFNLTIPPSVTPSVLVSLFHKASRNTVIILYLISYLMHSHSKGMKIEKETENGSWL